ncbi:conserved hypothetical protein [Pectobacterium atrosepticum SCRI1043]|uniref:DUF1795 domain-containing protein n=1 Tax=Pectobacterium atrosepticum (strain SCRI 1043 / ATCC BAA-672) TaxID=218491 RepID=Q6CZ76_PECAS|nr:MULTISPECIES: DUF1795 domain-containing protein [Pectobacterium]GKV87636.1 hypothetical protein PEC301296_39470 [Pectobacterium carotovorum subsp. carotovorum]AIA73053.1 hypothetical protein EV46_21370 [Pectobacterium atrosepticum]AIK16036.1 hypothetical protein GZ59_43490 [Pectobacterium atrosepticum]ATY92712.1 DUF1795 domain-containing protein [Pectobacterium atrosepticum]KFX13307.1 hypothetical protein JV34_15970 [Pectobacterium atrosepticum]
MYQMNEGTLVVPAQWRDESLHVFVLPDETTNLVVNRTPTEPGQTPESVYQKTLEQFSAHLNGYKEVQAWELTLAGAPAQALEYTWRSPEGLMHQVVVMQVRGSLLLTFTITAADALSDAHKAELLAVIATFNAAEPAAAPEGKAGSNA